MNSRQEYCQTTAYAQNCGLHCFAHALYQLLKENKFPTSGPFLDSYNQLIELAANYYQLPLKHPDDLKKLLDCFPNPVDRELVLAPVLRSLLKMAAIKAGKPAQQLFLMISSIESMWQDFANLRPAFQEYKRQSYPPADDFWQRRGKYLYAENVSRLIDSPELYPQELECLAELLNIKLQVNGTVATTAPSSFITLDLKNERAHYEFKIPGIDAQQHNRYYTDHATTPSRLKSITVEARGVAEAERIRALQAAVRSTYPVSQPLRPLHQEPSIDAIKPIAPITNTSSNTTLNTPYGHAINSFDRYSHASYGTASNLSFTNDFSDPKTKLIGEITQLMQRYPELTLKYANEIASIKFHSLPYYLETKLRDFKQYTFEHLQRYKQELSTSIQTQLAQERGKVARVQQELRQLAFNHPAAILAYANELASIKTYSSAHDYIEHKIAEFNRKPLQALEDFKAILQRKISAYNKPPAYITPTAYAINYTPTNATITPQTATLGDLKHYLQENKELYKLGADKSEFEFQEYLRGFNSRIVHIKQEYQTAQKYVEQGRLKNMPRGHYPVF